MYDKVYIKQFYKELNILQNKYHYQEIFDHTI